MPTPPYAQLRVRVNGGAWQTGGVTATVGDVIDFSLASTQAIRQEHVELYDYPDGFALPTNWSEHATSHVYYWDATTPGESPASITLDAALWGKYMFRLVCNSGDGQGYVPNAQLTDEATALDVRSPQGFEDMAAGETTQFSEAGKVQRSWAQPFKRALRVMDTFLAGASGAGGDFQESVLDKDTLTPPGAPPEGARYIIGGIGLGAWAGHDNDIATYTGGAWVYTVPTEGTIAEVEDENVYYTFNGAAWVKLPATFEHSTLAGLTSGDDHTQYALLGGRPAGQTLTGGTGNGVDLLLHSTSHATKGTILIGLVTAAVLQVSEVTGDERVDIYCTNTLETRVAPGYMALSPGGADVAASGSLRVHNTFSIVGWGTGDVDHPILSKDDTDVVFLGDTGSSYVSVDATNGNIVHSAGTTINIIGGGQQIYVAAEGVYQGDFGGTYPTTGTDRRENAFTLNAINVAGTVDIPVLAVTEIDVVQLGSATFVTTLLGSTVNVGTDATAVNVGTSATTVSVASVSTTTANLGTGAATTNLGKAASPVDLGTAYLTHGASPAAVGTVARFSTGFTVSVKDAGGVDRTVISEAVSSVYYGNTTVGIGVYHPTSALYFYGGASTTFLRFTDAAGLAFAFGNAAPWITQLVDSTAGVTGDTFTIRAQDVSGATAPTGGLLQLSGGNAASSTNGIGGGVSIVGGTKNGTGTIGLVTAGQTATAALVVSESALTLTHYVSGNLQEVIGAGLLKLHLGDANVASAGSIRTAKNLSWVARDNTNGADIAVFSTASNNIPYFGDPNATHIRCDSASGLTATIATGGGGTFTFNDNAFLITQCPEIRWASAVVSPLFSQLVDSTAGVTGDTFTIRAQNVSGTGTVTGGRLLLQGGSNTNAGATTPVGGHADLQGGGLAMAGTFGHTRLLEASGGTAVVDVWFTGGAAALGFFALATPVTKQTITGVKVDAVATSILAALTAYGLVTDSTT